MSPSFKFDSQTAFLTYPQCGLEHVAIVDHLRTLKDIAWARVCSEQHEDGSPHRHVVVKFVSRLQSRNARVFDVSGFHPNVQPVRSIAKAIAYVSKDGEFTDYGSVPAGRDEEPDWVALAQSMGYADYLKECRKHRLPFQYAKEFWNIGSKQSCEIDHSYEGNLEWETPSLHYVAASGGTNVIIGPSGMGKTSWAKRVCKKPALWVRHLDVLNSFRDGYHQCIIFDDMSFAHMPAQAQIHLVDQQDETHVHCRYKHAVIPKNTQRIFTCNNYPFLQDGSAVAAAIDRRISQKIDLYQ